MVQASTRACAGRSELLAAVSRKPKGEVPERTLLGNALLLHHMGGGPASSSSRAGGAAGGAPGARPPAALEGGFLRPLVIEIPREPGGGGGAAQQQQQQQRQAAPPTKGSLGMRLKHSVLGVPFHLRDLLGRGDLLRVQTPAGVLIRVNPAAAAGRKKG